MAETGNVYIRLPKDVKKGSTIEVKSIIIHPNHTGRVKDPETKKLIPAYFIEHIKVEYADKPVYEINSSAALSKDPYLAFNIKADTSGEVTITWKDSKGGVYKGSSQLTLA